ncbi:MULTISPECIES: hypothetical protein [Heyndrickxia]|uniref:hypothetical protein n=1 Tax=Heyndrickxia TaxID=2837504 RepID=UPI002DB9245B|nr:hypothetical protein [Weizmannia sp. CD-2023]MEC2223203.1 hypothetical protein [Weizmannia sp. CD-2023]MED4891628.1 hypothetical protein [Weizmannia sp. CD-2023]
MNGKMQEDRFNGNQKMVRISKRDYPSKANGAASSLFRATVHFLLPVCNKKRKASTFHA